MAARDQAEQSLLPSKSWPSRNHVAIYIRCLHLLDLDLLEDWPGVTEQLFTAKAAQQQLQQRVKAVEWSLYRLFEIYDSNETKDKLRPFFPPTTQLQSLNLRAALYRCLTELKKAAILGKDVILRKTMLDDCKGDRFEEIIASFAITTLKRAKDTPTSTISEPLSNVETLSINLAYRVSLHKNLQSRKDLHVHGGQEMARLAAIETDLMERLETSRAVPLKTNSTKQKAFSTVVQNSWIGNNVWTDILTQGVSGKVVLESINPDQTSSAMDESQGLLQDLEDRIKKQQDRLLEWNVIAKDLISKQTQKPASSTQGVTPETVPAASPRFSKHKALNLSEWKPNTERRQSVDDSYQELLSRMKQDFDRHPSARSRTKGSLNDVHDRSQMSTEMANLKSRADESERTMQEQQLGAEPAEHEAAPGTDNSHYEGNTASESDEQSTSNSSMPEYFEESSSLQSEQNGILVPQEGQSLPQDDPGLSIPKSLQTPLSPSKLWLSLSDRTRASISLTDRQSILTDPSSIDSQGTEHLQEPTLPDLHVPSDDDHHTTLLERTRKSMSMLSTFAPPRSRNVRAEKRTSQTHPVNQFETPGRPSQPSEVRPPGSGASTPRDQLFDEHAEYTSIFKSRPKLALSPAFSPEREMSGLDSSLERDMDHLNLDSDDVE